jgi:isoleucyl-tRNA synthetase
MSTPFKPINAKASFPQMEEAVLQFWKETDAFQKSMEIRKDAEKFTFYDGPPFATGLPHYGHILAGTIKDVIPRYQTMKGKFVSRKFGWDCHGVPVEHEMEKQLGFKNREDIENFGIKNFCESCRGIVLKYTAEWEKSVERMGRWVDFKNSYRTMDPKYMESILSVFAELWKKGLIYEGKKVVAYSPKLASTLSNFEANLNYKDIDDPAVTVKFKLKNEENTYVLAWTTTPWTLPSNLALGVNPEIEYVKVSYSNPKGESEYFILAKSIFEAKKNELFPKIKQVGEFEELPCGPKILDTFKGSELVGKKYEPLFPFFEGHENAFQILGDDFVSDSDGTGIVHLAPAYGEDDSRVCRENEIEPVDPIDKNGYFDETIAEFKGLYFRKDEEVEGSDRDNVNKRVLVKLREEGKMFKEASVKHSYPFCWRTDCALMYRGVPSIFVDVQKIKEKLIETNREDLNWIPNHIKDGRFGKLLENAPDWAISRSRYWGAPIPLWKCTNCDHNEVVGNIEEMGQKAKKLGSLFVARHGEGHHNVQDILSTKHDDGVEITEKGKEQAAEMGKMLAEKDIDVVYVSPLLRTQQTAKIIMENGNIQAEVITDDRICEINAGEMDGKMIEEWKAQFEGKNRFRDNPHNGESEADVEKRFLPFLKEISEKHEGKNILVVTHGALLRLAEKYFKNLKEDEIFALTPLLGPGTMKEYSFTQIPRNDNGEVDLHRPYVDKVVFECEKCGSDMHRIPDVLDCWFESGSMPYASQELDVRDGAPERFPADFIAEGLDQTRGWFYTLHVLGNALFQKPAFKNVIVNGIVLAEDGQKMSKSKKNYPDPQLVFDKYGADAMRFYLMNSQVVRAEDFRFSEEGVAEVLRKVILPLWNSYSFFVTYANIDEWKPVGSPPGKGELEGVAPNNKLDQWILAELGHLVKNFEEKMDAYELDAACREIPEFLDKLTNFYIRRNRRRFWKSEADGDKNAAFQTLYTVLKTFCQVLAPVCPYVTEEIWQNLKQENDVDSVHHSLYPSVKTQNNESLRTEIDAVRTIVSLALAIRAKKKIRVRQPLASITIVPPFNVDYSTIQDNSSIIEDEVNVKIVRTRKILQGIAEQIAKPDARKLGPKFGKEVQFIIKEAKAGNFVKNDDGTVTVAEKWHLQADEIEIGFVGKEGLDVESSHGIVVALDTEITEELQKEGMAREIIRHIQELRKAAEYDIADRITVAISGADEVVSDFGEMIAAETLAMEIVETQHLASPDKNIEVEIEGEKIMLAVKR